MYYITYMLRCSDQSFYVGSTSNLDSRMRQHASGNGSEYTTHRLPVELVWFEAHAARDAAEARERQIKRWSYHKKQALVDGKLRTLRALSRSREGLAPL